MTYGFIRRQLIRLGQFLGFENGLIPKSIRRGAAYMLSMSNAGKEERCARMGHKDGDGVYWKYYRNETSTFDFQAVVHSVEAENVAMLSSIALNRRPDAPTRPSEEAYREMWQQPHISALREQQLALVDQILSKYKTIKKAKELGTPGALQHQQLTSRYKNECSKSLEILFRREVAAAFSGSCPKLITTEEVFLPTTSSSSSTTTNPSCSSPAQPAGTRRSTTTL